MEDDQRITQESKTAQRPAPQPFHKHPLLRVAAVVLAIGGCVGVTIHWLDARHFEDTDDAFVDGEIVQISAKVPGIILSVDVHDNQDVAAGTVLAKIDSRDFDVRVKEAQASLDAATAKLEAARTNVELVRANTDAALAQAQAGVEKANAAIESSQSQLASVQADVTAAEAQAKRCQADLKRYKSLDPRAVSQQQLDAAQAAADAADANLSAARKKVSAAESAVAEAKARHAQSLAELAASKTGPQQIAAAEAQARNALAAVELAKAALDQANIDLSYTVIRAPVAGRVTRRTARPGQYLQVGQIVLALVEPNVWVTANFKENQLAHMSRGQDVEIAVDAYPGQTFHGKVDSIQAGTGARFSVLPPENATGNYVKVVQRVPVKILFDQGASSERLLAPGMSVVPKVRVDIGGRQHPLPIETSPGQEATTRPIPLTSAQ